VTAYLSVSSKAAGFVGLFVIVYVALPSAVNIWGPGLWLLAALSMTVGNLSALRQENIVRLMAYSSIAQAGFMLVPFAAAAVVGGSEQLAVGLEASVIYLVIYAIMNLGAFAVVIQGTRLTGTADIEGWAGLARRDPRLGVLIAVFFFSLAGIPPLAGWFAKFIMFQSAITAGGSGGVWLAIIAAVNAVIALYYYARIAKTVWFDALPEGAPETTSAPAGSLGLAIGLTAVATVVIGFYPPISTFFGEATRTLIAVAGG
jgi:NADH-quinone oxidoreductase subunit N